LIVLDTNVLSALMQQVPEPRVVKWLDEQPDTSVWITSITLFESRFGLALLPKGKRRQALETAFDQLLSDDLEGRVLDFDQSAAEAAALSRRNDNMPAVLWTYAIRRSRVSCSPGTHASPPETSSIFLTWGPGW